MTCEKKLGGGKKKKKRDICFKARKGITAGTEVPFCWILLPAAPHVASLHTDPFQFVSKRPVPTSPSPHELICSRVLT